MKYTLALAALLLAIAASPARADSLLRRGSTTPQSGSITTVTRTEVTIKPQTREALTIPANEILRARWDGEPAQLNLARGFEESGRLQNALEGYQKALGELPSGTPQLKADVEYLIARTIARMALSDPPKQDEAVKKLEAYRTAHANHFRYFESLSWQGQVAMAQGNFDAAQTLFDQMAQAPWNDYKMAARIGKARVLLRQEQFPAAAQEFEAVIGMAGDSPVEASRKLEAQLGKATCLHRQSQFAEAIQALDEIIHQVSPEDTALQAEAYLRQGDSLQAMGKTKEALLAYLHVDVLFPGETAQHAEALYHLRDLWGKANEPGRAGEAASRLQSDYPNSEWAKKLAGGS